MSKPSANLLKFRSKRDSLKTADIHSSSSNLSPLSSTGEPKIFLRQSGFNQIINEILVGLCRTYLEIPIQKRIVIYLCVVLVGGIVGDLAPGLANWMVPIRTQKTSMLNVYFVKLGWAWTIGLLGPFVMIVSRIIENRPKWMHTADLIRIVLATFLWFVSTKSFEHIENITGICSSTSFHNRYTCVQAGHRWHGFDISGHTFILLFSSLIIIEETKSMIGFETFGYLLDSRSQFLNKQHQQRDFHRDLYMNFLVFIRFLFFGLTFLILLWDFMLIQTAFFYHSFMQKILAYIWAVLLWYVTYKCLYPTQLLGLIRSPILPPTKLEED